MIRVYAAPGCGPCIATKRALSRAGVAFEELALADHPDEVEKFRAAGHFQAPIVVAGNRLWSGFRPEQISAHQKEICGTPAS